MTDTILQIENLYKLFIPLEYSQNKEQALALLRQGQNRKQVQAATGIVAGLADVSFSVQKGEIFTLIGLSGSGKSTLIRCLNMLAAPTCGKILLDGEDITQFSAKRLQELRRTRIAMVFQNFGLMNNRNVLENVYYGLEIRGEPLAKRTQKAREMLAIVGLEGWEDKSVDQLSGGMKQRVGIARALANDPDILLMDEAFSALDPLVRSDLQFELLRIQRLMGKTIVFITHDINEAFRLGSHVGILKDGRMVQTATPEAMLTQPADDYVRSFITNADSSKVLAVRNIMSKPTCTVRSGDGAAMALHSMQGSGVSSAYVVDDTLGLVGLITLDAALKALSGSVAFSEAICRDLPVIKDCNAPVASIMALSASAPYPLPVIDETGIFCGIVTKASVISSMALGKKI